MLLCRLHHIVGVGDDIRWAEGVDEGDRKRKSIACR